MLLLFILLKIKAFRDGRFQIMRRAIYFICLIFLPFVVSAFMKKLSHFNTNFWNSFQDLVYCQVLRSQTFCYDNGSPFNMTQNMEKSRICYCFDEAFVKNFIQKLPFLNINFQSSYQDLLYCKLSGSQTFCY